MQSQEMERESPEAIGSYRDRLDQILNRELNLDTIDHYADKALADLITLVLDVVDVYSRQNLSEGISKRDMEDAAFSFYGLDNLEVILDHVADISLGLSTIDQIIANVAELEDMIIPTDKPECEIVEGDGPFIDWGLRPRMKATLFVLANDFDVDLQDSSQIQISSGQMRPKTIRKESYYSIEVPRLNRTIFVCDENRNATFVFDNEALDANGISSKDLLGLTKAELGDLLLERPDFGVKFRYSNKFIPRLIGAIDNPEKARREPRGELKTDSYLYPKAPDDVVPITRLANELGVSSPTVAAALKDLGDKLGVVHTYRFQSTAKQGYTPEQQCVIREHLESGGRLVSAAPDGVLNESSMADSLGISHRFIKRAISLISDDLGEVNTYKFGPRIVQGYTEAQQERILKSLDSMGAFAERAPDGYLSAGSIAAQYGVAGPTVNRAIEELGEKIGEAPKYRFGARRVPGYSPEQQDKIYLRLKDKGIFDSKKATDNVRSEIGIARNLGVSNDAIAGAIDRLGDRLGEVGTYIFGTYTIAKGYSLEQQQMIKQQLLNGPRARFYRKKFGE